MNTPDKIWLIDTGDEIVWHDDPDPTGDVHEEDVVAYTRTDSLSNSGSNALLSASEAAIAGLYDGIYGGDSEYIRLSVPYAKKLIKELEKVVAVIKSR